MPEDLKVSGYVNGQKVPDEVIRALWPSRPADNADTYQKPQHGWTCFHCGETFKTQGSARDHFGLEPSSDPGCKIKTGAERGLLMALRKAEAEIWRRRDDDGPVVASVIDEMRRMQSRHSDALRDAEEAGYERGLADGLALPKSAG